MLGTKFGMTVPVGKAFGLMAGAGLAVSAHAGVQEIVWVEVDNSVGTMGDYGARRRPSTCATRVRRLAFTQ